MYNNKSYDQFCRPEKSNKEEFHISVLLFVRGHQPGDNRINCDCIWQEWSDVGILEGW